MSEFLAMDGYAAYVWSAYGITLAVLGLNVWFARRRNAAAIARVQSVEAVDDTRAPRPTVRRMK